MLGNDSLANFCLCCVKRQPSLNRRSSSVSDWQRRACKQRRAGIRLPNAFEASNRRQSWLGAFWGILGEGAFHSLPSGCFPHQNLPLPPQLLIASLRGKKTPGGGKCCFLSARLLGAVGGEGKQYEGKIKHPFLQHHCSEPTRPALKLWKIFLKDPLWSHYGAPATAHAVWSWGCSKVGKLYKPCLN